MNLLVLLPILLLFSVVLVVDTKIIDNSVDLFGVIRITIRAVFDVGGGGRFRFLPAPLMATDNVRVYSGGILNSCREWAVLKKTVFNSVYLCERFVL